MGTSLTPTIAPEGTASEFPPGSAGVPLTPDSSSALSEQELEKLTKMDLLLQAQPSLLPGDVRERWEAQMIRVGIRKQEPSLLDKAGEVAVKSLGVFVKGAVAFGKLPTTPLGGTTTEGKIVSTVGVEVERGLAAIDIPFQALLREPVKRFLRAEKESLKDIGFALAEAYNPITIIQDFFTSAADANKAGAIFGQDPAFQFMPEILRQEGVSPIATIPEDVPVIGGITLRGFLGLTSELISGTGFMKVLKKGAKYANALNGLKKLNLADETVSAITQVTKEEAGAIKTFGQIYDEAIGIRDDILTTPPNARQSATFQKSLNDALGKLQKNIEKEFPDVKPEQINESVSTARSLIITPEEANLRPSKIITPEATVQKTDVEILLLQSNDTGFGTSNLSMAEFTKKLGEDKVKGLTFEQIRTADALTSGSQGFVTDKNAIKLTLGEKSLNNIMDDYAKKAARGQYSDTKIADDFEALSSTYFEVFGLDLSRGNSIDFFQERLKLARQTAVKATSKTPTQKTFKNLDELKDKAFNKPSPNSKEAPTKPVANSEAQNKINQLSRLAEEKQVDPNDLMDVIVDNHINNGVINLETVDEVIKRFKDIDNSWTSLQKKEWLSTGLKPWDNIGSTSMVQNPIETTFKKKIDQARLSELNINFLSTVETTLRRIPNVGGKIADRILTAQAATDAQVAQLSERFFSIGDALHKKGNLRSAISILDNTSDFTPKLLEGTDLGLVDELRDLLNRVKVDARASGILKGELDNYHPHVHDFDFGRQTAKQEKLLNKMAQKLLDDGDASSIEEGFNMAQRELDQLARFRKGGRKALNIENSREFNVPEWLADPRKVISDKVLRREWRQSIERYLLGAYRRINEEKYFGKYGKKVFGDKYETFNELAGQATRDEAQILNKVYNRIYGLDASTIKSPIIKALRSYIVFSKLQLSSIANATQTFTTTLPKTATLGFTRSVQIMGSALGKSFTNKGRALARKWGAIQRETIKDLSRDTFNIATLPIKLNGFTAIEKFNNVFAFHAGNAYFDDLARTLSGQKSIFAIRASRKEGLKKLIKKELKQLGLDDSKIKKIEGGDLSFLTEADYGKAGWSMARFTQFRTSVVDLPLFASSNGGRIFFTLKTFAINHAKFLKNNVGSPFFQYIRTGGREGNWKPLMAWLMGTQASGEFVFRTRSLLADVGVGRKPSRDEMNAFEIGLDNLMWAGGFGIASDVVSAFEFGRGAELLLGPAITEPINLGEDIVRNIKSNKSFPEFALKKAIEVVPFIGRQLSEEIGGSSLPGESISR